MPTRRSGRGFLISDLCTIALVGYAAQRFWYQTNISPGWGGIALLLRLLAAAESATSGPPAGSGFKWLQSNRPTVATLCLSALSIGVFACSFSWRQAGAVVLALSATLSATRVFLSFVSRAAPVDRWEGLRFGALQAAALFAVHPYVRSGLLGAGDATSYSLMIADFNHQWRAGIFPIFIGQSQFAFNGGFHPLRNAPYLQHLAWAFDLLGLRTLNAFALQNLTAFASIFGGILGCYTALRLLIPRGPWLALSLAFLYGLSPGILAPLYGGDMYLTFMTLPFIPWLALGMARSAASPDRTWPWVMQGAALAAIWMAHPPVAAWATLLAALAGLWILIQQRKWRIAGPMILGLAAFGSLSAYLFVSVNALELPAVTRAQALATIPYKLSVLRGAWLSSLLPVSRDGGHLLGDAQLGYGLWACLLLSTAGIARIRSARPLLGCLAVLLLFAWPIPALTPVLWRCLPAELLLVTNQWPVERFYVLLAGLAPFVIALAFSHYVSRGFWPKLGIGMLLGLACFWSASEARKFFGRAAVISHSEAASEDLHRRENVVLSRSYSYEYLGTPAYFSNGHMDPRLETRLLDMDTRRVFADGTTWRAGAVPSSAPRRAFDLQERQNGSFAEPLIIGPGQADILRFDFPGGSPEGELQIAGGSLTNLYSLPQSGAPKAFGCGPESAHSLILENTTEKAEAVSFRFVGPGERGFLAQVTVEPWSEKDRAIRLLNQTPFQAVVTTDRDCYLETPKLYVPGYEAMVDGVARHVTRSPEGLVAVPLTRGAHKISLIYPGGRLLRWSYAGTAAAWLGLAVIIGLYASGREQNLEQWLGGIRRRWLTTWPEPIGRPTWIFLVIGAVVLLLLTAVWRMDRSSRRMPYGEVLMSVRLPWPVPGRSEPLVTTGRTGAGDFIYVTYLDGRHVRIGHDRWNYGETWSEPIQVDYEEPQTIEISLGSLYPDAVSAPTYGYTLQELKDLDSRLTVRWNGRLVLSEETAANPSRPDEVTIGGNIIGGSTTLPHFSGAILRVARTKPPRRN